MASYCAEKFENQNGQEVVVCWRQDKHVHNASFITTIEQALGNSPNYGGTWTVRANSYRSNLQSCPDNAVAYSDI